MKLLQINTSVNSGSHGRIAEDIGRIALENGHESFIAYGRKNKQGRSDTIRIGRKDDLLVHVIKSRLFDLHGFGSKIATKKFIERIKTINHDIIHLHNIHGYYLNVEVLFDFLKVTHKPVVWTLHDCWPFTGHCSHFEAVNCKKWEKECFDCPNIRGYPASWFNDNSRNNYRNKKKFFTALDNLTIITPSHWLAGHLKNSFLKGYPIMVINNGIDLDAFTPEINTDVLNKYGLKLGKYILGLASVWNERKGLADFVKLREQISGEINIVLVGLKPSQIKKLPKNIMGIERTESISELSALYSGASVFVNPTYVDNFPTTNLESLACGTPVVTYDTGGSPEAVDERTGFVVPKGDIKGLASIINNIIHAGQDIYITQCRQRATSLYDSKYMARQYLSLYQSLVKD